MKHAFAAVSATLRWCHVFWRDIVVFFVVFFVVSFVEFRFIFRGVFMKVGWLLSAK